MPQKIWDSKHQQYTIYNWTRQGLICREGETYKGIYSYVMSIDNCNQCSVKFNDEVNNEKRCMDHDHSSGYFRQVLCMKCNKQFDVKTQKVRRESKTGHRWITPTITKNKSGNISVSFQYNRGGYKRKASQSLTKLICLSFIQLLKVPI